MITYGLIYKIIIVLIFTPFIISNIKRKKGIYYNIVLIGFMVYTVLLVGILFFPIIYDKNIFFYSDSIEFVNLIPFKTIKETIMTNNPSLIINQILGNIIIFIPMGFSLPILLTKVKSLSRYFIMIPLISIFIESVQLLIDLTVIKSYRYCDIDDIILNTLGGILGIFIFLCANKLFKINKINEKIKASA